MGYTAVQDCFVMIKYSDYYFVDLFIHSVTYKMSEIRAITLKCKDNHWSLKANKAMVSGSNLTLNTRGLHDCAG